MPESLLDQIHAARTVAESCGQHEFARWLTAHANEACPAAIAQAMRSEEVNEAIALVSDHQNCRAGVPCVAISGDRVEAVCNDVFVLRPVVAALADAERRAADTDRINNDLRGERVEKIERIATLTRQLEAARGGLREAEQSFAKQMQLATDVLWQGTLVHAKERFNTIKEYAETAKLQVVCALAAIDALAAEPSEQLPAGCSGVDWCALHEIDHGHPVGPDDFGGSDFPLSADEEREMASRRTTRSGRHGAFEHTPRCTTGECYD